MSIPKNISGSRAAAVLGLSQWSTPVNVWLEIMGREFCEKNNFEFPVFEGNAATRWGTAFESAIIELTGKDITDREKFYERDYLTCHVDGIIDGSVLYEAKTTSAMNYHESWGEPGTDQIPMIYQLQVQHNLLLTGLESAVLSVLVFPRRVEEWEEMGWMPEKSIPEAPSWIDFVLKNTITGITVGYSVQSTGTYGISTSDSGNYIAEVSNTSLTKTVKCPMNFSGFSGVFTQTNLSGTLVDDFNDVYIKLIPNFS